MTSRDCKEHRKRQVKYRDNLQFVGAYCAFIWPTLGTHLGYCFAIVTSCPWGHNHDRILLYSTEWNFIFKFISVPGRIISLTQGQTEGFAFTYASVTTAWQRMHKTPLKFEDVTSRMVSHHMACDELGRCHLPSSRLLFAFEDSRSLILNEYTIVIVNEIDSDRPMDSDVWGLDAKLSIYLWNIL